MSKGYTPPSRAELQAMRELKQQNVPNGEAGRREQKLLQHYASAQEDLQWIVDNNAWTDLGFETFTTWYSTKIQPVVAAAGLRPTQEFALYVLAAVRADEAMRPPAQRLLQRELAGLVGVSESTLRRLSQDRSQPSNGAGADLDEAPKSPLVEAMTQAIEDAQTAAGEPNTPADGGDMPEPSMPPVPPASGPPSTPSVDGPDVTPEEVEQYPCEACGGEIARDQRAVGYARCDTCDPDGEHHRPELDGGGLGPCGACNPAPEESAGFTARQREDAARQLGYLDSGALTVTGAVKHFVDVDCVAAEDPDEAPRWASTLATATCRDCLNVVAQDSSPVSSETVEAPAGQPQVPDVPEVVPIVAMDQPGTEPPIAVGEASAHASVPAAGVQPLPVVGKAPGGDEVEGEAAPSSSTDLGNTFMADWRRHAGWLLGLNAEAAREWLTPFEVEEIKKDLETLIWLVGKLDAP